ncbi:MAG: NAD-dependent epimerase/dehydratase family protein [Dehalococcoidia bacterium]
MKVLVTGGAGFIGSQVVDALLEAGHRVAVVDNLATGIRGNLNPKATFYEMSILDGRLAEVFDRERPQIVNHHAAQISVTGSVADPAHDAQENILGSLNVITNSVRSGVQKFVYASTGGAIYGEIPNPPAAEDHPVHPLSPYAVSKHAVELYLDLYSVQHDLDYVILRYANVYGPRQNPQGEAGVVSIFATQMLKGERPTIFGEGDKTRDYVYVSDVVEANILAMGRGRMSIYNIGTGVETSDQEVFDTLARALRYRGAPIYEPVRKGEVERSCLDWTRAREGLGWRPAVDFEQGISRAVGYYRSLSSQGGISL